MNEELINWQTKYESGEVIITGDEELFVVRSGKNLEKGLYPVYIEDAAIVALKQIFNLDVDAVFDKDTTGEFVDYFTDEINKVLNDKIFYVKEEYYPPNSTLSPKLLIALQVDKLNEMYQKLSGSASPSTSADPETGGVEFDGRIVEGAGGYVYGQSPDGTIEILDGPTSVGKVLKEGPAWEAITEEIGPFPEPVAVEESPDFEVIVFEYEDLSLTVENVVSVLDIVGKSYECAYRNGEYNNPGLRFGKKIKDFKNLMTKLDNELRKSRIDTDIVSQIGFKIRTSPRTNTVYVEEIQVIYPGIADQDTVLIRNAEKKNPFNNQASVYLLKNAPKISQDYEAGVSEVFDYKKFIASYIPTTPSTGVDSGAITKYAASRLDQSCGTNLAGNFADEFPGNQTVGDLTDHKDCVSDKFPKTFYTIDDRENLLKVSENEKLNRRRVVDALNTIEDKTSDILALIKQDIDESKNLRELMDVFGSLNLQIIQDLLVAGLSKEINLVGGSIDSYQALALRGVAGLRKPNLSTLYYRIRNSDFGDLKQKFDEAWVRIYGETSPIPSVKDLDASITSTLQGQNLGSISGGKKLPIGIPTSAEDPIERVRETLISAIKFEGDNFPSEDFMTAVLDFIPSALSDNPAFDFVSKRGQLTEKFDSGFEEVRSNIDRASGAVARAKKAATGLKNKNFTLPKIPNLVSPWSDFKDLTGQLTKVAERILEQAAVQVLKKLATKMFSTNLEGARALVTDNLNGSPKDTITNIMRNGICTNRATPEEVAEKVLSTLENFAALNLSGADAPSEQDVKDFMEKTSSSLSQQEIIDLFRGNPSDQTLRVVSDVLNNSLSGEAMRIAIPTDSDIENVFLTLGSFINVNGLQLLKDRNELLSRDFDVEVCDRTLGDITADDRLREQLIDRGLSESDIEEQANLAVKNALENLDDFLQSVVVQGEASPAQAIVDEATKAYESEDRDQAAQNSELFDETFESLTTQLVQDLMMAYGAYRPFSKGYFDMILSVVQGTITPRGTGFLKLNEGQREGQKDKVVSNLYTQINDGNYPDDGDYITNRRIKLKNEKSGEYFNGVENVYGEELNITRYDVKTDSRESINIPVTYDIREETLNYINSTLGEDYTLEALEPSTIFKDLIAANIRGGFFKESLTAEENNDYSAFAGQSDTTINEDYLGSIYQTIFEDTIMPEIVSDDQKTKFWNYGKAETKTEILDAPSEIYGEGYWYRNDITQYTGWRNIYNEAIPTSDFDVEKDPLFNFNSCAQFSQEYYDSVPADIRATYPRKLFEKVKETPFSRVNSKISNAMLAGLVNSIIKLYVFDAVIKMTPLIGLYELNTENYTNVFSAYISNNIVEEVLRESLSTPFYKLKRLGQKGYYYIFLEQVVQSYANMASAGLISPSLDAKSSLASLTASLESWNPETATVKDFRQFIEDSKNDVRPIIQEMVEGVFPTVAKEINRVYSPKTKNINNKIINEWLYTSTIVDVPETINDVGFIDTPPEIIESIQDINDAIDAAEAARDDAQDDFDAQTSRLLATDLTPRERERATELLNDAADALRAAEQLITDLKSEKKVLESSPPPGKMPFFIQKYIKLSNETDYRIIKISEYKGYKQKEEYPNASFGIRLVFYPGNTYDSAVYSESVKLDSVFSKIFERDRAFLVKDGINRKHNIPFYSFERETTPEEIERGYPTSEMLSSLKASPGFEILFRVCYPLSDLLSTTAVYMADNFILSIEEARGSGLSPLSDLGRWNGKIFEVSQKYIKNMMETSYYARSSDYRKQILKNINKEQIIKTGSAIALAAGAPVLDKLPKEVVGKLGRGKEVFPQRDEDGTDPRSPKKEKGNR